MVILNMEQFRERRYKRIRIASNAIGLLANFMLLFKRAKCKMVSSKRLHIWSLFDDFKGEKRKLLMSCQGYISCNRGLIQSGYVVISSVHCRLVVLLVVSIPAMGAGVIF